MNDNESRDQVGEVDSPTLVRLKATRILKKKNLDRSTLFAAGSTGLLGAHGDQRLRAYKDQKSMEQSKASKGEQEYSNDMSALGELGRFIKKNNSEKVRSEQKAAVHRNALIEMTKEPSRSAGMPRVSYLCDQMSSLEASTIEGHEAEQKASFARKIQHEYFKNSEYLELNPSPEGLTKSLIDSFSSNTKDSKTVSLMPDEVDLVRQAMVLELRKKSKTTQAVDESSSSAATAPARGRGRGKAKLSATRRKKFSRSVLPIENAPEGITLANSPLLVWEKSTKPNNDGEKELEENFSSLHLSPK